MSPWPIGRAVDDDVRTIGGRRKIAGVPAPRTATVILSLALCAMPISATAEQVRRIAFLCPTVCTSLPYIVPNLPSGVRDQAFMNRLTAAGLRSGENIYFDMVGASASAMTACRKWPGGW